MSATLVPVRGKQLAPLPIGGSVVYRFILTGVPGPDPETWSTLRFSICDNDGQAYFTVPKADMTVDVDGTTGDYEAVIDIPVTAANSGEVEPNPLAGNLRYFQLDFATLAGYRDVLVDGTVPVFVPFLALA
jgi:hypothetical protein